MTYVTELFDAMPDADRSAYPGGEFLILLAA